MRGSRLYRFAGALLGSEEGAVVIETAVATPVLAVLALGTFDVSQIVTRQMDLQSCAHQGEELALASNWGGNNDVNLIASILTESFNLRDDQVEVERLFRCDAEATLTDASTNCAENAVVSTYVRITLTDSYTPLWTKFGVGSTHQFNIVRLVQLS